MGELELRSRLGKCKRCSSPVSDDHDSPKCLKCENIRFERGLLAQKVERLAKNYEKARSLFGLAGFYLYGSYPEWKERCGDVDVLITYDKEVFLRKAEEVWDFRKCEEYPDCLPCWESGGCPLPSDDYHSPTHTYCTEECRVGYSLPRCDDDCIFLEMGKRSQIFKAAEDALFDGVVRTEKVSGMDVKVVDLYLRESVKVFEDEFAKRDGKKPRLQAFTEKSGGKG